MAMKYTIKQEKNPHHDDVQVLGTGIMEYAAQKKGHQPIEVFAFFIRDENNVIQGGCSCCTLYGCLYVDQLWLEESLRGKGYGTQLMLAAEKLGREQGCTFTAVNTMDWEALGFYKKMGYEIEFERRGFLKNSVFYFLRKKITSKKDNHPEIRLATPADNKWLEELMDKNWGGLPLVIRGQKYYPSQLDGIIAENAGEIAGFLFYEMQKSNCEIIVFEVFDKHKGTGTLLLDKLKNIAKNQKCSRIYLMTTNDNLDALRFYQKRGFHICGIHIDSVKLSRKLKPTIGMVGDYDIPVRDEIDLEFIL